MAVYFCDTHSSLGACYDFLFSSRVTMHLVLTTSVVSCADCYRFQLTFANKIFDSMYRRSQCLHRILIGGQCEDEDMAIANPENTLYY